MGQPVVAVAVSYVVVSYTLMPLYFLLIQKLIHITIRSHLSLYFPAFMGSLVMLAVVLGIKNFLGENFSMPIRLALLVIAGALTYLVSIRLIRPAMFTKILELARLALPKLRPDKIELNLNNWL